MDGLIEYRKEGENMPITALIVDDTEETREVLSILVAEAGAEVIGSVADGVVALEFLQTHPADLIFTDYQMPIMDGITLAQELRIRYPRATLVMITVLDDPRLREQAAFAGIDMFLPKPITLATLETLVASLERIPRDAEDWDRWLAQWTPHPEKI